MMDWLSRLPDGALAVLAAIGLWFGFNYAVLADRAMSHDIMNVAVDHCIADMEAIETSRIVPLTGIGSLLGMPELDALEARIADAAMPPLLSVAEKSARCACAASVGAAKLRFDYAIHTASFRIVPVNAVSEVRIDAGELLNLNCGS